MALKCPFFKVVYKKPLNASQTTLLSVSINVQILKKSELVPAILFFFFVLCILLQDIVLQEYFGTITKSPVVFVAPLLFFLLVLYEKKLLAAKIIKYYFYYVVISISSSLFLLVYTVFFVTHGSLYVYTEFMPFKLIRASFYNITYFFCVYILFALIRRLSINTICRVLQYLLFFLIVYGILQILFNFNIPFINATPNSETRIPLTASEPSNAAPMFLTIAITVLLLRFYLRKSIVLSYLLFAIIFFMLVFIASKGSLLLIPVAFIIAIRKKINFRLIIVAFIVMVPIITAIVIVVIPSLLADIQNFTSFSTRVTSLVAAGKSVIYYPFGEGYGTYLVYYPPMLLPTNVQLVHLTGLPFLDTELREMVETGKNLPAKSGIANEIVYNGFIAVIFIFLVCRHYTNAVKKITNETVKILFSFIGIFLLIVFLFATNLETAYYYLLPIALVYKLSGKNIKEIAAP